MRGEGLREVELRGLGFTDDIKKYALLRATGIGTQGCSSRQEIMPSESVAISLAFWVLEFTFLYFSHHWHWYTKLANNFSNLIIGWGEAGGSGEETIIVFSYPPNSEPTRFQRTVPNPWSHRCPWINSGSEKKTKMMNERKGLLGSWCWEVVGGRSERLWVKVCKICYIRMILSKNV